MMRSRLLGWALGLVAATLMPAAATAHPHVFIDVRVQVEFDGRGNVSGFSQTWLFDELFSTFIAGDMDGDGDGQPDPGELEGYLEEVMGELEAFGYYTEVSENGDEVPLSLTGDRSIRLDGANMEISFSVALERPVSPAARSVRYAVFDPTYYIDMLHADADDAITLTGAPAGCDHRVIEPNPDPETVDLAASLDATQSAGDTLGAFFAEWVVIDCGPSS